MPTNNKRAMETFTLDTFSMTDYYYDDSSPPPNHSSFGQPSDPSDSSQGGWVILLVVNVVILLLGVFGNGVVIWIAGLKMKKTVNTTWYLSLAISDFIFCACLPFNIISMVTKEWMLGLFMCKFTSFVIFLNMFSSIFLLVVISVDRYVLVVFPVWAQNQRTVRRASVVVVLAWAISVALSIPSTVFRQVTTDGTTNWLPYHVFIILEFGASDQTSLTVIHEWLKISATLASANSCMNPFLYAFMGKDFKQKCWNSFLSKIENAFDEEEGSSRSRRTSFSQADSKVNTNV
ncbi:unnamed protein product [Coregonus sp. 'balchen']|nr:unnamed protein product [Coregonus sp. 'balchen']